MFCAAMISAAFSLDDPREIIEAGLAEIPQQRVSSKCAK
jgi:hypothetical protein